MDVRLLGPIEVRLDDRLIELGPRKQRAVFVMLALHAGKTVSTDRIVDGLWGDDPPASAPKMVQLYVSHLRRALGSEGARIVTRGRGYELRLPRGDVDVVRAEQLLEASRAREALGLWRGEPLADVAAEPFAAVEIRRLREMHLRATELAIDADLATGRHTEVLAEIEALVGEHPLREGLHGRRMLALYRSGRQAEALEAYRAARTTLVEQIGVEPGTDLRELHAAILAQDTALDVPRPKASAAIPRRPPRAPDKRLVAAAGMLVAGVLAFGVIRVREPAGLSGIRENSIGVIESGGARITTQYAAGRNPSAVVAGGGSVWTANAGDGTVTRIDRKRGKVVTIPVGGAPAAVAFAAGSLWVADSDSREVVQVSSRTDRAVRRIEVGNAPRALAVAAGSLWVASGVDGQIARVDLARGRVTGSVAVGVNPSALVAGAGALWVASEEAATVTRINPGSAGVVGAIGVGNGPSALASGEGAIWVVNRHDGTMSRIDPATNSVSGLVNVGSDPTAVAAGGGRVWVAGGEDGTVARVDPSGPRVIEKLKTGSSPSAITVADGSVWAAATAPRAAHQGGTLRVLVPTPPDSIPIDPLRPRAYQGVHTFQLSSLAYDGLVAYRRVAGAAGATLVGALATAAPPPSRDGRSYVFVLRRGLRFSDGRPVRPDDFRASIERFLKATRSYPKAERFPDLYSGILGARRCTRGGRCDLSRGIVTDSRARTITVHLQRPDAEFLHKLTMMWAAVVPAGSRARATDRVPPPGTGPYRVASWDAKRGGLLVRNPHFRDASRSRPDGFADRIDVRVRRAGTTESQIAAVQRGTADLAVVAGAFGSYVAADRLRALATDSPGRVHSAPVPTTDWLFLDVRRRPFDNIDVRRAINLAFDRARVVALTGGPEVGQPACQVLPVAFPAHAPYCPYTTHPSRGGVWTAPDLKQARRLVAASGRVGDRIIVWMPPFRRAVGRYFTALLNRLGFHATLRIPPGAGFGADTDEYLRAHTVPQGWAADYLAPSTFIETNFTCDATADRGGLNLSRLCDSTLERQIRTALALPPAEATAAWAAADQHLTDVAAAVPMTQRRAVVLVSRRVGNVQHHPQLFTLLDQLWVK